jgi:hypothetical protein
LERSWQRNMMVRRKSGAIFVCLCVYKYMCIWVKPYDLNAKKIGSEWCGSLQFKVKSCMLVSALLLSNPVFWNYHLNFSCF